MGFFEKIRQGLARTTQNIGHSFSELFAGELDDDFYDTLEETLILSDMGVDTALAVTADTVAMSTPHEIDYTLTFDSATLAAAE